MTPDGISRILIVNRGEIAVRIARTCREMGITTIVVYSDADADALHVRVADEAYRIGPSAALESYLKVDAILTVAQESGAQAIHPGYGFLAENASFARAVQEAGLIWIGPPPDVIAHMGDKVAAKALAGSANVPVVPGYDGEDGSTERMLVEAGRIGYPVMVKAAAGGGGKGMRAVGDPDALPEALEAARREARSAFGNDRVFLEKLIVNPRHIEIQLLLDSLGNGIYLGERDCSIQRRHQKVVEESPSPILTADVRAAMGEAALRLARAGGYINAGTVEFLYAGDQFYFLEMNTRIQVEHPVTEMVTGLDLVRLQIEIASGQKLGLSQLDVTPRGHSIEVRIYAEDPGNRFLPSIGTIVIFQPPDGPGIRSDVGVYAGAEVTPHYDPMLAKLIVQAPTREHAVSRMERAIGEYLILGVANNLDFLRWVAAHPDFQQGRYHIGWLDENWQPGSHVEAGDLVWIAAAIHDALAATPSARTQRTRPSASLVSNPWSAHTGWRQSGLGSYFEYRERDRTVGVSVTRESASEFDVSIALHTYRVEVVSAISPSLALTIDGHAHAYVVAEVDGAIHVQLSGKEYRLARPDKSTEQTTASAAFRGVRGATAPMPGTVVKVMVAAGQEVGQHQTLVVLEAMKMEHVVEAPRAGIVRTVLYREGEMVPAGAELVEFEDA